LGGKAVILVRDLAYGEISESKSAEKAVRILDRRRERDGNPNSIAWGIKIIFGDLERAKWIGTNRWMTRQQRDFHG